MALHVCCVATHIVSLTNDSPNFKMTSFLIRNVRLFDGEDVTDNTSVLVRDGFIASVGADTLADGVPVIEKPGHTLLPGLIDAHVHPDAEFSRSEQAFRFGITTLMDMQNRNAAKQKQQAKERKDFPDVKSAHSGATIENGWPAALFKQAHGPEVCRLQKRRRRRGREEMMKAHNP
jgi:dihydroorotase-like cyclic amidohydrolase